jgi:Bax protein
VIWHNRWIVRKIQFIFVVYMKDFSLRQFMVFVVILLCACDSSSKPQWTVSPLVLTSHPLPNFSVITDLPAKKAAFTEFLLPSIEKLNRHISAERNLLLRAEEKFLAGEALPKAAELFLVQLAQRYKYTVNESILLADIEALKRRVDQIPAGLVLAQAANESAWGTSRFAKEANNFFGQWCYKKGCGLVPLSRSPGRSHEVRKFSSVEASIAAYMLNLNTNRAYRELRTIRVKGRTNNRIDALALANGLNHYSERGQDYVKELRAMIRRNAEIWPSILIPLTGTVTPS